ncbi:MAG TPA: NAD(P)/FAD-dependent oxidoreductase [Spirochaetota bacterium]
MSTGKRKVAIIGAGASGMMAAIHALRAGSSVTVFEKQQKVGRKLAVTGNGQCNISNRYLELSRYHGRNPLFVRNLFSRFGLEQTIDFFELIGIPLVEKKQGKLYPQSLQAQSVVDILDYELRHSGGEILLHRRVDQIEPVSDGVKIITAGQERLHFDAVILAAGGCSYPQLGASHQGYELAEALGHTIIDPFPAILPINIALKALHRLEGIKCDVELSVMIKGAVTGSAVGEILFTRYGISGPVTLEISRLVNEPLLRGDKPEICINLFPDKKRDDVVSLFDILFASGDKGVAFALAGVLKKRVPEIFVSLAGVDPLKRCADLSVKEKNAIVDAFTSQRLSPGEIRSFSEAVISAGGVSVDEIVPATMESKKARRVYLCGELLDIDGDSGGFNLQFAWSSGAVAGMAQGS